MRDALPHSQETEILIIGDLRDSYRNYQEQLAEKVAQMYPEIGEYLAVEILGRQLKSNTGKCRTRWYNVPWRNR